MLSVADAHVAYGSTPVLQGVNLTVQTGEIVSIIGRNGAGKTTLLKAIIGLLPLQRGTLTFNGADLTALPAYARARRGLGYVPQGRMIFPNLTVLENLQIGADLNQSKQHGLLDEVLNEFPILRERQRQRSNQGESRLLNQHSHAVAQVLPESVHKSSPFVFQASIENRRINCAPLPPKAGRNDSP